MAEENPLRFEDDGVDLLRPDKMIEDSVIVLRETEVVKLLADYVLL